jgi:hypothetical protein
MLAACGVVEREVRNWGLKVAELWKRVVAGVMGLSMDTSPSLWWPEELRRPNKGGGVWRRSG